VFQLPNFKPRPAETNYYDISSKLYSLAVDKNMSMIAKRIELLQSCSHFANSDVRRSIKVDIEGFSGLVDIFRSLYTQDLSTCSEL